MKGLATEVMFDVMKNDLFDEGATALILASNFPFPSKDYNEWKNIAETGKGNYIPQVIEIVTNVVKVIDKKMEQKKSELTIGAIRTQEKNNGTKKSLCSAVLQTKDGKTHTSFSYTAQLTDNNKEVYVEVVDRTTHSN